MKKEPYNYLVKLDCDLSFSRDYFRRLLDKFEMDPRLGIAGGWVYDHVQSKLKAHIYPRDHVRGALKTYRRCCFEEKYCIHSSADDHDVLPKWLRK